jgi:hypothetical protein
MTIKKALFREFIPCSPLTNNRMLTKRTPNKSNMATKSQNTTTGQRTLIDQGTATAATRAVKQGAAIQAALKQWIKDAQTATQNKKYNLFIFMPMQ